MIAYLRVFILALLLVLAQSTCFAQYIPPSGGGTGGSQGGTTETVITASGTLPTAGGFMRITSNSNLVLDAPVDAAAGTTWTFYNGSSTATHTIQTSDGTSILGAAATSFVVKPNANAAANVAQTLIRTASSNSGQKWMTQSHSFQNLQVLGGSIKQTQSSSNTKGIETSVQETPSTTLNEYVYDPGTGTVQRGFVDSNGGATGGVMTWNDGASKGGYMSIVSALPNGTTATTQSASDNSTKVATTAYVDAAAGGGLSSTLTDAHVFVGNGSNIATDVAVSGDVTMANTGAVTLATVTVPKGGTGATSLTDHGVIVGSGTSAVDALAVGTDGQLLIGQSSADPSFNTMSGDATISKSGALTLGTVGVAKGGTGATTLTAHGVVVGNGTSAVNITGAGTSGQVLTSNGASADPTFQTPAGGGEVSHIQRVLTSGEMLALSTSPQQVLAAPGAGKAYIIQQWSAMLNYNSATYTNGGNLSLVGATTAATYAAFSNAAYIGTTSTYSSTTGTAVTGNSTGMFNEAINVKLASAATTGNSTVTVDIWYSIYSPSLGWVVFTFRLRRRREQRLNYRREAA